MTPVEKQIFNNQMTILSYLVNQPGARSAPYEAAIDSTHRLMDLEEGPTSRPHKPFGFSHGDPLIVVPRESSIPAVSKALGLRALYVTVGTSLMGHRFSRAILLESHELTYKLDESRQWIDESVRTCLEPGGSVYFL